MASSLKNFLCIPVFICGLSCFAQTKCPNDSKITIVLEYPASPPNIHNQSCWDKACSFEVVSDPNHSGQYQIREKSTQRKITTFNENQHWLSINVADIYSDAEKHFLYDEPTLVELFAPFIGSGGPRLLTDIFNEIQTDSILRETYGLAREIRITPYSSRVELELQQAQTTLYGCAAPGYRVRGQWIFRFDSIKEYCDYEVVRGDDLCPPVKFSTSKYVRFILHKKRYLVVLILAVMLLGIFLLRYTLRSQII